VEHGKLISAAIGVGAWLIAAALNILHGPQWLGWIFLAVGSGFIICALLWWAQGSFQSPGTTSPQERQKDATTASPASSPELGESEPEERTFIDVTPAYLVGQFKGHTDLQAMPLTAPFLGKWMRVSGTLGNVLSNRETISQVTFQTKSPFSPDYEPLTVFMYFDRERWDERLAVLPPGSEITVVGRVREVDRVTVHLEDCELES
jgi:hypothetical protein